MAVRFAVGLFLLVIATSVGVFADSKPDNNEVRECDCIPLSHCDTLSSTFSRDRRFFTERHASLYLEYVETIKCGADQGRIKVCCPSEAEHKYQYVLFLRKYMGVTYNNYYYFYNTTSSKFEQQSKPPTSGHLIAEQLVNSSTDTDSIYRQKVDNYKNIELNTQCGTDLKRFTHGEADFDDFPWLALLEFETPTGNQFLCGGSLINDEFVLTSARCFDSSVNNLTSVRLGEHDLSKTTECPKDANPKTDCPRRDFDVGVRSIIIHDEYNKKEAYLDNRKDIALVRLAKKVTFGRYVYPVCLPSKPTSDRLFAAAGWNRSKMSAGLTVKTISKLQNLGQNCYNGQTFFSMKHHYCVGKTEARDNYLACVSDAGGPLMGFEKKSDGKSRVTIYGIFAQDLSCSVHSPIGMYAKVDEYMPWINDVLRQAQ